MAFFGLYMSSAKKMRKEDLYRLHKRSILTVVSYISVEGKQSDPDIGNMCVTVCTACWIECRAWLCVYVFILFLTDETILPLAHVLKHTSVVMCAAPRRNDRKILLARLITSSLHHPILTGMKSINCCGWGLEQERTELIAVSVSNVTRPCVHLLPVSFVFSIFFFRPSKFIIWCEISIQYIIDR